MKNILDTKIGTKFEIELIDSLGGRIGGTYTSQLLDIKDSENITIAAPIQEAKLLLIPSGSNIRCIFLHPKYGLISFSGVVTKKERLENVIAINITITSKLYQIQRRNHFRLDYLLDVQYKLLDDTPCDTAPDDTVITDYKKAHTKDISGCGACIIADEPISKGSFIQTILYLDADAYITVKSKVVRCFRLEDMSIQKYNIGLSFIDIPLREQETLIKFIFDKQKQLLRNKPLK